MISFYIFTFYFIFNFFIEWNLGQNESEPIVDSNFGFNEIFYNSGIPDKVKQNLELISVEYYSFDNKLHRGQILVNQKLAKDIHEIFKIIKTSKFPIAKAIPVNHYGWSDDSSMADNNTSAFNYRKVSGSYKLSAHALGRAIDINPKLNPHVKRGINLPPNSKYDENIPGTIRANSFLVKEFGKRGWKWGGYWRSSKDYQHFEKLN